MIGNGYKEINYDPLANLGLPALGTAGLAVYSFVAGEPIIAGASALLASWFGYQTFKVSGLARDYRRTIFREEEITKERREVAKRKQELEAISKKVADDEKRFHAFVDEIEGDLRTINRTVENRLDEILHYKTNLEVYERVIEEAPLPR